MQFYEDESAKAADKQSLIFALMDVHLARLRGNTRAGFPTKVLNFFMAIHCLSPKASEMVTANLQGVSKRHIQRVSANAVARQSFISWTKRLYLLLRNKSRWYVADPAISPCALQ
jgi:hypothetical protein